MHSRRTSRISWSPTSALPGSPIWRPDWVRILKPEGVAILSGFEANDIPRVSAALEAAGARIAGEFGEQEWRMLEARIRS